MSKRSSLIRCLLPALLIAAFLFGVIRIVWFVKSNMYPPYWDDAYHLATGITYSTYLARGQILQYVFSYHLYPPFIYQTFGFLYSLFPSVAFVPLINNLALLLMVVFVICWSTVPTKNIHRKLYILAAVLFPFFTLNMIDSRAEPWINLWRFMLDVPAAIVILAAHLAVLEYLWGTRPKRISALLFSIFFSFSISARSQTAPYLLLPGLVFLTRSVTRHQWRHVGLFIALTAGASLWYILHWTDYIRYLSININDYQKPSPTGLAGMYNYLALAINAARVYLFVPLSAGILFLFSILQRHKRPRIPIRMFGDAPAKLLLGSAAAGFCIFSLLKNQDYRFILPSIILLFAACSYTITRWYPKQTYACSFILIVLFFYTYTIHFPIPTTARGAYTFTEAFIRGHQNAALAFYFETDSVTYNLDNIRLLEARYARTFVAGNNPNRWASKEDQTGCYMSPQITYFFVYSTDEVPQNPSAYFPAGTYCKAMIQNEHFTRMDTYEFPDYREKLTIYVRDPKN